MNKYFTLTKVLLSGVSLIDIKTGKKNAAFKNAALMVLLVIAMLPTAGMIYYMADKSYYSFSLLEQEGIILAAGFLISSILVFMFALFLIPAVFYFSKDIEVLLYLPVKPETILSSKFTITLLYECLTNCVILAPVMISFIVNKKLDIVTIIFSLICFVTIPVIPLVYASLISMVIMRFAPFVKNRDTFNFISGIMAVVVGISISALSGNMVNLSEHEMIDLLLEGDNSLLKVINTIFPNVEWGVRAIADKNILYLLGYLAISAFAYLIFVIAAKVLYFKGAIGIGESTAGKKNSDIKKTVEASRKQAVLISYILKEWRILFRTPIYFLNCILMMLIMPILLFFPTLMGNENNNMGEILNLIDFSNPKVFIILVAGSIGLGFVYGTMNSITSSSISREGQNYYFMKYIPVKYRTQIDAKVLSGIIPACAGCLLVILPISVIVKIEFIYIPIIWILSIIGTVLTSYIGIIIDLFRPVLVWENEQKPVKQNLNVMISMLIGMALAAGIVYTGINVKGDANLYAAVFLAVCLVADVLVYLLTHKLAGGLIEKL